MTNTLQPFKETDLLEPKFRDALLPTLETLGDSHDDFWNGADTAANLGDVLFALDRDPMANGVLTPEVYRKAFWAIHQIFTRPGTFEFYLEVFRAIWGDDVEVVFTVPLPGVLQIGIGEITLADFDLAFREIVSDVYVYSNAVTEAGEQIIVRDTLGTKNQSEVNALMQEISPDGIFATATLTL